MKVTRKLPAIGKLTVLLALVVTALSPASDLAFTHVQLGDTLTDLQMFSVGGSQESYLGPDETQARVFAFIKPDHGRSEGLLSHWTQLQADFAGQPVSWVLVISDRHESGPSAAWDSLAPGATVLVDSGDQLYGQMGVPMTPVVGIADQDGVLQSYLPYRRINYATIISAHVQHVMGTISDDELAQLLNPSGGAADSLQSVARRHLKLGKMLLDRERLDAALAQVEDALHDCPDLAEGYELLAEIHLAAGRTAEAEQATARALALTPAQRDSTANPAEAASSATPPE